MATMSRSAVAVAVLVSLFVSCGDDAGGITASEVSLSAPSVTNTMAPSLVSVSVWEPAHEVPSDMETRLAVLLSSDGAWMLVPSAAPIEGPTLAEVMTLTPGNDPTAVTYTLAVRPEGSNVLMLSLSSSPADFDPCSTLFPEYASTRIRGLEGCTRVVDGGVDFLHWLEDGRWFHAEWDEIDVNDVVSWLGTWRRIP